MRTTQRKLFDRHVFVGTNRVDFTVNLCSDNGNSYTFCVDLPGRVGEGSSVSSTDLNQLLKDVEARITAGYVTKWKRYIYVQLRAGQELRKIPEDADDIRQLFMVGSNQLGMDIGIVEIGVSVDGTRVHRYPEGSWYASQICSGTPDIAKFEIDTTEGNGTWESGALLPYSLTMARAVSELRAKWWTLDQRLLSFGRHKLKEKLLKMYLEGIDTILV